MDAKTALRMAVLWDVLGLLWLVLGLTDEGPMDWRNWVNVGLGAFLLLSSSYYWALFVRQRRKDR
jgi:hypothetical protein